MSSDIPVDQAENALSAEARALLNTTVQIWDDDAEEAQSFLLGEYPHQFVFDLFEDRCGMEPRKLVDCITEEAFHPGYCPDRILDLRTALVVNGEAVEQFRVGEVERGFDVWTSGQHGDGHYPEDVPGVFHWCSRNCKGVWIMTTDQHIKSWDYPHDVYVSFLDPADAAAYLQAWGDKT